MQMLSEHEKLLGVNPGASKTEIRRAFRRAAKTLHPDTSSSPEAEASFLKLKQAYDALMHANDKTSVRTQYSHFAYSTDTQPLDSHDNILQKKKIAKIQDLDEQVFHTKKRSLLNLRRSKESEEVRRHRKKLKTNARRLRGLY